VAGCAADGVAGYVAGCMADGVAGYPTGCIADGSSGLCVRMARRLLDVLDDGIADDLNDSVTGCLGSDW
jgi:hypothetical protein